MKIENRLVIKLDGDDIQKIVDDHIEELALNRGYSVVSSRREEPYPDIEFRCLENE